MGGVSRIGGFGGVGGVVEGFGEARGTTEWLAGPWEWENDGEVVHQELCLYTCWG